MEWNAWFVKRRLMVGGDSKPDKSPWNPMKYFIELNFLVRRITTHRTHLYEFIYVWAFESSYPSQMFQVFYTSI